MIRSANVYQQMALLVRPRCVSQTVQRCDLRRFSNAYGFRFHLHHKEDKRHNVVNPLSSSSSSHQVTVRSLSSTQQCLASRFYNPKIGLTMRKNIAKGTDQLLAAEERARVKREKRLGSKPNIKNPLLDDTRKTKTFNLKFQENIGNVMADIPQLLGHGIAITRVNTRADFSEVLVFWVSSPQKVEEVADLLEMHVRQIRRAMIEHAGLGQLPRITFVKDIAYMLETELDGLFRKLDTGPKECETTEQESEKIWEQLEGLELGSDGLGLDRAELIRGVEMQLEKREAKHRYTDGSTEEFCKMYRKTLARDGGKEKEKVEQNIKTFLRQRKRHHRDMNDI